MRGEFCRLIAYTRLPFHDKATTCSIFVYGELGILAWAQWGETETFDTLGLYSHPQGSSTLSVAPTSTLVSLVEQVQQITSISATTLECEEFPRCGERHTHR